MDRIDKKTLNRVMRDNHFVIAFLDYNQFKQIKNGTIAESFSVYEEVYDIDDCFQDKQFIVVFMKQITQNPVFIKVEFVDIPSNEFEKNDNDFIEYKSNVPCEADPVFYYVRGE